MLNNTDGMSSVIPLDLIFVAILGLVTVGVGNGHFIDIPGQLLIGLLAILFAPGYAFVSVLFPKKDTSLNILREIRSGYPDSDGVTPVERVLLAIAVSISLVPVVGIGLSYTPQGVDSATLLAIIGSGTILISLVAFVRRLQVPARERFNPTGQEIGALITTKGKSVLSGSKLTLIVMIGLVIAGAGIGVAVINADHGEDFSSLYLLSEDPETGEAIADNYPEEIPVGETEQFTIGIENHEGQQMEYTVVTQLQAVDSDGRVEEVQTMDQQRAVLQPGETWEQPHTVTPEIAGEQLRVTYLLFKGDPPAQNIYFQDDAYRTTHIWIDVPEN